VLSAVVAVIVGFALGWGANKLLGLLEDVTCQIGLTLLVPYASCVLAEELHGCGVLAVLTTARSWPSTHGRPAQQLAPAAGGGVEGVVQLQADQPEGDTGDEGVDDVPDGVSGRPGHHVVGVGARCSARPGTRCWRCAASPVPTRKGVDRVLRHLDVRSLRWARAGAVVRISACQAPRRRDDPSGRPWGTGRPTVAAAPREPQAVIMTRNVVISGAGTGIGLATARMFADHGDRVLLLGRRADVLREARVPGALTYAADVADVASLRGVTRFVADEMGAVDVLIHSAGGSGQLEPRQEREDPLEAVADDWTTAFRLNTLTAVLLTEALRSRLAEPGGRVLFLSSIAAYRGSGRGAYAAAKAALHPYAHALARELGPHGITVNVVAPGYVEDTAFFGDTMDDARRERLVAETLDKRPGTPGDVAATLHWLASPAAAHITSQIIQVNGGAERGH
jgi:3-oxoacyl-[acyl-carrier protein] reductase